MPAPLTTKWGNVVTGSSDSSKGRLGVYTKLLGVNNQILVNVQIWFWTLNACQTDSAVLSYDIGEATTVIGSMTISHTDDSNTTWNTHNQTKLLDETYYYSRSKSAVTYNVCAELAVTSAFNDAASVATAYTVPALAGVDWTKSMEQSYEYYTVNPTTLADVKRIDTVKSADFSTDADTETLCSATIDLGESIGETYVRGYLKTIQNGVTEKFPLGTVLIQTMPSSFDGRTMSVSADAYSPLIELKEKRPPIGYTIRKGANIMAEACRIIRENTRVPVTSVSAVGNSIELKQDFTANTEDTWLSFIIDLIKIAKYTLRLEETGRITFQPIQELESLQPIWTFDDGNSSILYPEITMDQDLYGIPNVVEVIYSYGTEYITVVVKNEDPNSPVSIANRGREIVYRDTNPSISVSGTTPQTKEQVREYAERLLKSLSTIEYTVSYTHAYCPVRVGDCVRLNYEKAGITDIKAKVISQNVKCDLGCSVSEKAVFTTKLWGSDPMWNYRTN